jgi:hypothetical protein
MLQQTSKDICLLFFKIKKQIKNFSFLFILIVLRSLWVIQMMWQWQHPEKHIRKHIREQNTKKAHENSYLIATTTIIRCVAL